MADDPLASFTPAGEDTGTVDAQQGGGKAATYSDAVGAATGGLDPSGYPDTISPLNGGLATALQEHAGFDKADVPMADVAGKMPDLKPLAEVPQQLREEYGRALLNGETTGPQDFASRVAGVAAGVGYDAAAPDDHPGAMAQTANLGKMLADALPSHEDLIDWAGSIAHSVFGEARPGQVAVVKSNLLDIWAQTGASPESQWVQAQQDPTFRQSLTQPEQAPVSTILTPQELAAAHQLPEGPFAVTGLPGSDHELVSKALKLFQAPKATEKEGPPLPGPREFEAVAPPPETTNLGATATPGATEEQKNALYVGTKVPTTSEEVHKAFQDLFMVPEIADANEKLFHGKGDLFTRLGGFTEGGFVAANLVPQIKMGVDPVILGAGLISKIGGDLYRGMMFTAEDMARYNTKVAGTLAAKLMIELQRGNGAAEREVLTNALEKFRGEIAPLWSAHQDYIDQQQAFIKELATAKQKWIAEGNDPAAFSMKDPAHGLPTPPTSDPIMNLIDHIQDRWASTEPNVAPGMTRLYRGEGGGSERAARSLSAKWWSDAEIADKKGRWFTQDRNYAVKYAADKGMSYVDVPTAEVNSYRVSRLQATGEEPYLFTKEPALEFYLPRDISETRQKFNATQGGRIDPQSPLFQLADALRQVADHNMINIQEQFPDFVGIPGYFRQLWKNESEIDKLTATPGSAFAQRHVPYYYDGIASGLIPKTIDPIDNMLHYTSGMIDYLGNRRTIEQGVKDGYVYWAESAKLADDLKLDGWVAQKTAAFPAEKEGEPVPHIFNAYSVGPGFGRIYNNSVGRGIESWPIIGAAWPKVQAVANGMIAGALTFSGYHYWNMAQESWASALANTFGARSPPGMEAALKDAFGALGIAPNLNKGARLQDAYLRRGPDSILSTPMGYTPMERQLAQVMRDINMRPIGRGEAYYIGKSGSIIRSVSNGTLKYEVKQDLRTALSNLGDTSKPIPRQLWDTGSGIAGMAAHYLGSALRDVSAPLFDKMVPRLKVASWANEMQTFMRNNPGATPEKLLDYGRTVRNAMDDRFGEMNLENLHWNPVVRQIANLGLVSVGWELGTFRAFSGVLAGATAGPARQQLEVRARWMAAFPIIMAIQSSAYQMLKGQGPPTSLQDLWAPRTGGTVQFPHSQAYPERALLPGPQKEVMQWAKIADIAMHSASPFALWTGTRDYMENKASPFDRTVAAILRDHSFSQLAKDIGEGSTPIPLQYQQKKGSAISRLENFTGVRPAYSYVNNRADYLNWIDRTAKTQARKDKSLERYKNRQLETPPAQ